MAPPAYDTVHTRHAYIRFVPDYGRASLVGLEPCAPEPEQMQALVDGTWSSVDSVVCYGYGERLDLLRSRGVGLVP